MKIQKALQICKNIFTPERNAIEKLTAIETVVNSPVNHFLSKQTMLDDIVWLCEMVRSLSSESDESYLDNMLSNMSTYELNMLKEHVDIIKKERNKDK